VGVSEIYGREDTDLLRFERKEVEWEKEGEEDTLR